MFKKKKVIDKNKFIRELDYFLNVADLKNVKYHITLMAVVERKKEYVFIIEMHRPGLLIGKGGRVINDLKEFMNTELSEEGFKKPVKIELQESKMWNV